MFVLVNLREDSLPSADVSHCRRVIQDPSLSEEQPFPVRHHFSYAKHTLITVVHWKVRNVWCEQTEREILSLGENFLMPYPTLFKLYSVCTFKIWYCQIYFSFDFFLVWIFMAWNIFLTEVLLVSIWMSVFCFSWHLLLILHRRLCLLTSSHICHCPVCLLVYQWVWPGYWAGDCFVCWLCNNTGVSQDWT